MVFTKWGPKEQFNFIFWIDLITFIILPKGPN